MKEDKDSEIGDQIQKHSFYINYWCQTNNCNNPTIAESIVKAVKDHYDLSTLHEVFKVNITETTTTTTTTTTTDKGADSTTKGKPNNTSSSLHIFINMMIFIGLLLIFHNFSF
jgi:hypothetical protein